MRFVLRGFNGGETCDLLWGAGAPARGNTGQERGNMGYGTEEQHICLLCRREIYNSNK